VYSGSCAYIFSYRAIDDHMMHSKFWKVWLSFAMIQSDSYIMSLQTRRMFSDVLCKFVYHKNKTSNKRRVSNKCWVHL